MKQVCDNFFFFYQFYIFYRTFVTMPESYCLKKKKRILPRGLNSWDNTEEKKKESKEKKPDNGPEVQLAWGATGIALRC